MKEAIEALTKLLELLFKYFSPDTVVLLIFGGLILLFGYKIYTDWNKRNEVNSTIKSKDETIQILNEQNRQLRVIELQSRGWSIDDIEAVVMKETPKDPIEARELVRKGKLKSENKSSN